jgi:hypothetical protein
MIAAATIAIRIVGLVIVMAFLNLQRDTARAPCRMRRINWT